MFTAQTNIPLPKIPYRLQQQIKLIALEGETKLHKQSGAGIFECKHLTNELYGWLRDNIVSSDYDISKIMVQSIREGNFEPHIDGPSLTGLIRHYNLMYIIDTGGEHVKTQIYNSPSELIKQAQQSDYRITYDQAELIESFEFEKDTWNLLNNQMFHSVEGITRQRIGLSISFYDAQMPDFLLNLLAKMYRQDTRSVL